MQSVDHVSWSARLPVSVHPICACALQKYVGENLHSVLLDCHTFEMVNRNLRKLQVTSFGPEVGDHNLKSLRSRLCSKDRPSNLDESHDAGVARRMSYVHAHMAVLCHVRVLDCLLSHDCFAVLSYIDILVQIGLVIVG